MGKILRFSYQLMQFNRHRTEVWVSHILWDPQWETPNDSTMIHIEPENEIGYFGHVSNRNTYILNIYYTNGSLAKSE